MQAVGGRHEGSVVEADAGEREEAYRAVGLLALHEARRRNLHHRQLLAHLQHNP